MIILIADQPGTNSYLTSLIEAYKAAGLTVICGYHNFFYSNIKPDILHIQWPEKMYNWYPFSSLSEEEKFDKIENRLKWYKQNNVQIIHTIHNIKPHILEKFDFEEKTFKLIIYYSDILFHHCKRSIELLKENYPEAKNKKNIINPHGDYLIDYKEIPKNNARFKLGITPEKFVILNFGSQQNYKGEDFIDSVFNNLKIKDKFLLTAGNYVYESYSNTALLKLRNTFRQKFKFKNKLYVYRRIPSNDLPFIVNSCDVFFLAHQKHPVKKSSIKTHIVIHKISILIDKLCAEKFVFKQPGNKYFITVPKIYFR